jgi:uncharacterized protein YndB with AHSA1/START domain
MGTQSFTTAFTVEQTAAEAFAAVNDVRAWWSQGLEGDTHAVGDEFTYRHHDVHRSTQRVTELVPDRRVVWHVIDGHLSFVQDTAEWAGTDIAFDVTPTDGGTEVRLTHVGLVPQIECFEACSNGWAVYFNGSLRTLITTGTGQPDPA